MQLNFIKDKQEKIFLFFGFLLVLSLGFFSGYFYFQEQADKKSITIKDASQDCKNLFNSESVNNNSNSISFSQIKENQNKSENISSQNKTGMFVASKNSKIYHKPDCKYVKRIKEKNKIWFQSAEEAEKAGYTTHNCK